MSTDPAHALRVEVARLTRERDEARDRVSQLSSVVLDRGQQIAAERERFSAALAAANARADRAEVELRVSGAAYGSLQGAYGSLQEALATALERERCCVAMLHKERDALRAALEKYRSCRHACVDCFCVKEARAALASGGDRG